MIDQQLCIDLTQHVSPGKLVGDQHVLLLGELDMISNILQDIMNPS